MVCIVCSSYFFIHGCSKEELLTARGWVIDSGPFSNGGCEWIIVTTTERFQPDNLPDTFKIPLVDSLPVEFTYRLVRSAVDCPPAQNYSGVIHLTRIKKI